MLTGFLYLLIISLVFGTNFFNQTQDIESSAFTGTDYQASGVELPKFNVGQFIYDPFGFGNGITSNRADDPSITPQSKYTLFNDKFGVPLLWNFRRLWDMLGYGSLDRVYKDVTPSSQNMDMYFTLLDFMAYHKIFYSFYNKSTWFKNETDLYNVDWRITRNLGQTEDRKRMLDILTRIHYRPFSIDYFTNAFPQPIFGDNFANAVGGGFLTSTAKTADDVSHNKLMQNLRALINPEGVSAAESSPFAQNYGLGTFKGSSNKPESLKGADSSAVYLSSFGDDLTSVNMEMLSPSDIRAAFALDKLLRITALNGGHYEEQTLAHFGYKMPKGIAKEAYYLGSQHSDININEVVATSTTTAEGAGSVIGDIAGKGFSVSPNSDDLDFQCPCHGYIMALSSIEPIADYASYGCEVQNRYMQNLDFFRPELDNLGMQPMFGQFNDVSMKPNFESVFGWTYRYAELKTSFDVVNEGFHATNKNSWVTYKQSGYNRGDTISPFNMFYISPQYTNNIFLLNFPMYGEGHYLTTSFKSTDTQFYPWSYKEDETYSSAVTATDVYSYDNFLLCMDLKFYLSSPMSVHSLPKLL